MIRRGLHEDRLERMKLLYDLNKHITTLATGILLLIAGLLEKVFKEPIWMLLAGAAFVSFAFCVALSVFAMLCFALYSRLTWKKPTDPTDTGVKTFAVALMLFILGIILFTIFAVANLFWK
jgi:uncharacterized paraquat-inducible protein A